MLDPARSKLKRGVGRFGCRIPAAGKPPWVADPAVPRDSQAGKGRRQYGGDVKRLWSLHKTRSGSGRGDEAATWQPTWHRSRSPLAKTSGPSKRMSQMSAKKERCQ